MMRCLCKWELCILHFLGNRDHALFDVVSRVAESQIRTVVFGFTVKANDTFHSQIFKEEDTTLFVLKGKENFFVKNQIMFPVLSHT